MNADLEKAKHAIARVNASGGINKKTGTAFYVGNGYVLTALHVIADTTSKPPRFAESITLTFHNAGEHKTPAVVKEFWDLDDDWVVLECKTPPNVAPIERGPVPARNSAWESFGYPEIQLAGMAIQGTVSDPNASLEMKDGSIAPQRAMQLFCQEAAAGMGARLYGLSGAPCLVGGKAVGVLRRTLIEEMQDGQLPVFCATKGAVHQG
jgi:trypsin-like peptidase